jgi:chromosome partitioning protein
MLSRKFGKQLIFETKINRSVKHREATVYGRTIYEHAPDGQPAAQFLALVNEVAVRLGGQGSPKDSLTEAIGRG